MPDVSTKVSIPWFGARRFARGLAQELATTRDQLNRLMAMGQELVAEVNQLRADKKIASQQLAELGLLSVAELDSKRRELDAEITSQANQFQRDKLEAEMTLQEIQQEKRRVRQAIVETDELTLLQEVGIYKYRHPLTEAVAYQTKLSSIEEQIKSMAKKDGGAVLATTSWSVNGSEKEGRNMVKDFSKLMLRAFNAEADNLVRGMKPFKLDSAIDRLTKVSETIERLGKTMNIRISPSYLQLRVHELEVTADFLQKQAEEKEAQRLERERLKEERKAQQEIEAERERLEKEKQHYSNALDALVRKGDEAGAARLRETLNDVEEALVNVDYRAANIRAGYVYVISNIGSFGNQMVKVGMTRRLDPMDRIRELSDASVPFNFDVHALFFSANAVGIETEMHDRLASARVNTVNHRREFFRATPVEAKQHLAELAGELLEFQEVPEALEYRQAMRQLAV